VEELVDHGVSWWNSRRKIYKRFNCEEERERQRQRALNPAYEPRYSKREVQKAAEAWATVTSWHRSSGQDDRPIRDVKALKFFPHLEEIALDANEVTDVSVLAGLPKLRVLKFGSKRCEDLTPLARCRVLRELELTIGARYWRGNSEWPDVTGLDQLVGLEKLLLAGNLLTFPAGMRWPNVRQATLKCEPLAARCVRDLPQLPACEFLTLAGVERLDGIEAMPRLRNLKLESDVRDFTPLTVLDKLTCFTCSGFAPLDVSPLIRLPRLQVAKFDAKYQYTVDAVKPRDFGVFAEAPMLRELQVEGCAPVESEVRTLNSLLPSWDDLLLAEKPRPVPKLRLIVAPWNKHPNDNDPKLDPEEGSLPDQGLRECQGRWVARFVAKTITARLGVADWGQVSGGSINRHFFVTIESFEVVERLPEILAAMQEVMARLRHEYTAGFMIALINPRRKLTAAEEKLEKKFRRKQDEADYERRRQELNEHLERIHRFELKKQLGEVIKPEEFVPAPLTPLPDSPWEEEDDEDEDDTDDLLGKSKQKADAPPSWWDDEHPMAEDYSLLGNLTFSEIWMPSRLRDLAVYLMRREPDLEIPEDKKAK